MAASDVEVRQRVHRLVDDLDGTQLAEAEVALARLRQAPRAEGAPRRTPTLHLALGLAATDRPPPTDEEVERWLEERRMEKYGG